MQKNTFQGYAFHDLMEKLKCFFYNFLTPSLSVFSLSFHHVVNSNYRYIRQFKNKYAQEIYITQTANIKHFKTKTQSYLVTVQEEIMFSKKNCNKPFLAISLP